MDINLIRNFSIIAHIDHGKSTLADRLLEITNSVSDRLMQEQYLDTNPIERERGITIKLAPVRMMYPYKQKKYILNMIDTPGHVDFGYEVSRSLAACEGTVLVIDATSGIQAQTLTVYRQAKAQNLTIIPVINKIDMPAARVDEVSLDIMTHFGFDLSEIIPISAKSGLGVDKLLAAIIDRIPAPKDIKDNTKALVFDSKFDTHRGVIADIRMFSGQIKSGEKLTLMANNQNIHAVELGFYQPDFKEQKSINIGEVGYICTGLKDLSKVKVGDTVTTGTNPASQPLAGYMEPKPMVFLGVYPADNDDFGILSQAIDKLHLNDASFSYTPEYSASLGKGFRMGFAGLLHAEIVQERLEREFDLDLIATTPNVIYQYQKNGKTFEIETATDLPDQVDKILEPWLNIEIFTPQQYLGGLMELLEKRRATYGNLNYLSEGVQLSYQLPMAELVTDFYDQLKSISSGYASLDYKFLEMREVDAVKLDILIHHEIVAPLSQIVVREQAQKIGQTLVKKLKEVVPRQQFEVAIQAAIGGTIIARATVKALRKDVTAKLYGGDVTRRMKLLQKQKKGKKRMKQFGKIQLSQDVFMAVIKRS